ncbi:MAG TPA: bifunctional nuclease family protein [Nitrospiria bacterium]|nr:bifunctional nuclease family protein [Nitrospiria bacterium]
MLIQMRVRGLMLDPPNNYVVILRGEEGQEVLPIWIGKAEANSISLALENVDLPRPLTHDLMKNALDALEAKVISVVITELKDSTYFAKLHLLHHDAEITVDTRPSDAIALALRTDSPIFVAQEVLQRQLDDEDIAKWLENLRPEDFGKADA